MTYMFLCPLALSPHHLRPMELPAVGQVKGYAGLDIISKPQVAQSPDTDVEAVMMDIPKDRMTGKRRASFILFSKGRT